MGNGVLKVYILSQIEYWKVKATKAKYSWEHDYARGLIDALEDVLENMEDKNDN